MWRPSKGTRSTPRICTLRWVRRTQRTASETDRPRWGTTFALTGPAGMGGLCCRGTGALLGQRSCAHTVAHAADKATDNSTTRKRQGRIMVISDVSR
jgi:hypothetical protein